MSDEAHEKLATPDFLDAFKAWLDAPSGDQATNDRLADAVKSLVAHTLPVGRPLHTVSEARDLATEREQMTERRWGPEPGDDRKIREHLDRQRDLTPDQVRLDDGRVVRVGEDAEGEGDDEHQ
jgi:hypothetical protein